MKLVEMKEIHKKFSEVQVLQGINLEISTGEFVAITGSSGSGKSTLLGVLGLLENADSGDYFFRGQQVAKISDTEQSKLRNKAFGFIFQMFHLLPGLNAWENVARPLIYAGIPLKKRKERAMQTLEALGVAHRATHKPTQLSGGEQQRIAIARALVNNPDIILADEPTGNLPRQQWEPILETLKNYSLQGRTVILVTHDPEAARWAQRQIRLVDGKVVI